MYWLIDWWMDVCMSVLSANNDRDVMIVESATIATQTTPGLHKWRWTSMAEHLAMDCLLHTTWTVYHTTHDVLNSEDVHYGMFWLGSSLGKSVFSRDVTDSTYLSASVMAVLLLGALYFPSP